MFSAGVRVERPSLVLERQKLALTGWGREKWKMLIADLDQDQRPHGCTNKWKNYGEEIVEYEVYRSISADSLPVKRPGPSRVSKPARSLLTSLGRLADWVAGTVTRPLISLRINSKTHRVLR